jgi:hypothetical protein
MIVLFSACFAFYMVEVVRWQKLLILRRKPFTCVVCLSAWTGLVTALISGEGWHSIFFMFISGMMGLILERLVKRYLY